MTSGELLARKKTVTFSRNGIITQRRSSWICEFSLAIAGYLGLILTEVVVVRVAEQR